jgi:hypothetical protein
MISFLGKVTGITLVVVWFGPRVVIIVISGIGRIVIIHLWWRLGIIIVHGIIVPLI